MRYCVAAAANISPTPDFTHITSFFPSVNSITENAPDFSSFMSTVCFSKKALSSFSSATTIPIFFM